MKPTKKTKQPAKVNKPKTKNKQKTKNNNYERKFVIQFIKENCKDDFIYIDQDSPYRLNKSGFDFIIVNNLQTVFVEAKQVEIKKEYTEKELLNYYSKFNFVKLLSPYQKITRLKINYLGDNHLGNKIPSAVYNVLVFFRLPDRTIQPVIYDIYLPPFAIDYKLINKLNIKW